MNNLLRTYSNYADAPDIPNDYALGRLLDRRIVFKERGKLRYEHVYEITFNDTDTPEYDHVKTIDHGGDGAQ